MKRAEVARKESNEHLKALLSMQYTQLVCAMTQAIENAIKKGWLFASVDCQGMNTDVISDAVQAAQEHGYVVEAVEHADSQMINLSWERP